MFTITAMINGRKEIYMLPLLNLDSSDNTVTMLLKKFLIVLRTRRAVSRRTFMTISKQCLAFMKLRIMGLKEKVSWRRPGSSPSKYLKELDTKDIDQNTALQVKHALDLPIHWWIPRIDTRWFIDFYERREGKNHRLLELAKLDFNIVQGIHQEDLKDMIR
ncbi:hypothetical protein Patl1_11449 [Pistacia atlantica]|uniref:Uncharacterized protein n=1 Tax=Pistacia atlantica TaxID=434234 RepID=A0ACC1A9R6_9ROSI|nr:hypothetical protein Patl1_11449 [Pistacia atlantica]